MGYERLYNTALQKEDREAFIAYMTEGQPSRPANMENIVAINQGRQQEPLVEPEAPWLSPQDVAQRVAEGYLILDARSEAAFGAGHIPDAYNVQLASGQFEQRVGWVLPADKPLILVVDEDAAAEKAMNKLAFVGLDRRIRGVLKQGMDGWLDAGLPTRSVPQMTVQELREAVRGDSLQVLDVRDASEYAKGHVPGALNIPYRQLEENLPGGVGQATPVAVMCSGGQRSSIASSILLRHGFEDVINVTGGMGAYEAAVGEDDS